MFRLLQNKKLYKFVPVVLSSYLSTNYMFSTNVFSDGITQTEKKLRYLEAIQKRQNVNIEISHFLRNNERIDSNLTSYNDFITHVYEKFKSNQANYPEMSDYEKESFIKIIRGNYNVYQTIEYLGYVPVCVVDEDKINCTTIILYYNIRENRFVGTRVVHNILGKRIKLFTMAEISTFLDKYKKQYDAEVKQYKKLLAESDELSLFIKNFENNK